jgi:lia operon protein LiaF
MVQSLLQRIFWGIVLIGIGVVFLFDQIGVLDVDFGDLARTFWPVFVILVGVHGLLMQPRGGYWWNFFIILIGVFFLGRNLDWFEWEFGDLLRGIGPFALILFGLMLIFRGNKPKKPHDWDGSAGWNPVTPPESMMGPPPAPPTYDSLNGDPSFGGKETGPAPESPPRPSDSGQQNQRESAPNWQQDVKQEEPSQWQHGWKNHGHHGWKEHGPHGWKKYGPHGWKGYGPHGWKGFGPHEWRDHGCWHGDRHNYSRFIGDFYIGDGYFELRPMNISHFIGDTRIDLTRAQIPYGETRINVSSFIGDVKVFVPNDFTVGVRVESNCLIGDVKVLEHKRDGLFNHVSVETPGYRDCDKQIVLVVSTFIGDVRVSKVG